MNLDYVMGWDEDSKSFQKDFLQHPLINADKEIAEFFNCDYPANWFDEAGPEIGDALDEVGSLLRKTYPDYVLWWDQGDEYNGRFTISLWEIVPDGREDLKRYYEKWRKKLIKENL